MSSEDLGSGLIVKTAASSSYKCTKRVLFKKSKAKELFGQQIHPLKKLMSCFDREQSIVIQRRGFSGSTPKVSRPAQACQSQDVPQEKDAMVVQSTPAASQENRPRAIHTSSTFSTIKLKNLKERMKDSNITEDQRLELEIEYADCLCNLGRYREACLIYCRAFSANHEKKSLTHDRLKHFIRSLTKVTAESVVNSGDPSSKFDKSNQTDNFLVCLPGQTCPDPLSCPVCAGVLCNPISLPCGHTYCRKCILQTEGLHSSCLKCGAPWQPKDCLLPLETVGPDENVFNHLRPNVLIGKLVQKFWSDDLLALELRSQGNSFQQKGFYEKAIEFYTQALKLAPNDHFLYGNRSLTYYKMGSLELALQDAIKATELRPDWAKGHYRKGSALQALQRHEEAFQAFYECLTLEDEKSVNQVKHELSKELFVLLTSNTTQRNERSSNELGEDEESSDDMDLNDQSRVIPSSMEALVEFASTVTATGTGQPNSSLPAWMTRATTPFKIERRPILSSVVIDSQDYECPLCIQVMVAPVTTPCGHTFCRRCLDRSLDHSAECPMCKSSTLIYYLAERRDAVNEFIHECMTRTIPEEYSEREKSVAAELMELAGIQSTLAETANEHNDIQEALSSSEVPIFVCTISFPTVRCPLHIFEPRYRLMIRRTMEVGTRQFGITSNTSRQEPFSEYGTMLEICDIHALRDGRSVIDTRGRRRFRVLERRIRDGYNVASVEFLKDDSVAPEHLEDLKQFHNDTLKKTKDWFFSVPADVRSRFESHYGGMPPVENEYWELANGPAWHWWTMTILPLDPQAQVNVLGLTSLKKRLEVIQRILKYLQSNSN